MLTAVIVFGVVCIALVPLLFAGVLIVRSKLGSELASGNPALWEQMKPGMYSDIRVSRQHRERLKEFISTREYLTLNNPSVSRLAVAYNVMSWLLLIAICCAALTVVAALKWG